MLPITGTPYSLSYSSDRMAGYLKQGELKISLTGPNLNPDMLFVGLQIEVAGQVVRKVFDAAPNLSYRFMWNGKDVYGRKVQGSRWGYIEIRKTSMGS